MVLHLNVSFNCNFDIDLFHPLFFLYPVCLIMYISVFYTMYYTCMYTFKI